MSNFLGQFVKDLAKGDQLKDWQHASKTFVADNMRLAPKQSFLFHVAFDFNVGANNIDTNKKLEAGLMVKSVALPKFSVDTKTLNAYNRPNIAQTKIKYDPITITFHDDSANVIRDLWYDYYTYNYRDADHSLQSYHLDHKYQNRFTDSWGFQPLQGDRKPYFQSIRIYQLHMKQYTEYILINPIITSWQHGEQQQGSNELVEHSMTFAYESIQYTPAGGRVSSETVPGMGEMHYDKAPSPLTPAGGGTNSLFGVGGLANTANEIIGDISQGNILGAVLKGAHGIDNIKGMDFKGAAIEELSSIGKDILRGNNPSNKFFFPTLGGASGTQATNGGLYGSNVGATDGPMVSLPSTTHESTQPLGTNQGLMSEVSRAVSTVTNKVKSVVSNNSTVGTTSQPSGRIPGY